MKLDKTYTEEKKGGRAYDQGQDKLDRDALLVIGGHEILPPASFFIVFQRHLEKRCWASAVAIIDGSCTEVQMGRLKLLQMVWRMTKSR